MKRSFEVHLPLFLEKLEFFTNLANENSLSHAYLFFGDEGVGKFTFALLFAQFLENGEFGGVERHPIDTMVVHPDEKGIVSVDAVRDVKSFLSKTPLHSSKRIVIVKRSEVMTKEAQSAFLKIVEEPPRTSLIIFVSNSLEVFFPPLASRLLKIYFPRASKESLAKVLSDVYGIDIKKAQLVAQKSYGRIGMAIKILSLKKAGVPADVEEKIALKILELREKDIFKYSSTISNLLKMQTSLGRYNLNKRLQEKKMEYLLRM